MKTTLIAATLALLIPAAAARADVAADLKARMAALRADIEKAEQEIAALRALLGKLIARDPMSRNPVATLMKYQAMAKLEAALDKKLAKQQELAALEAKAKELAMQQAMIDQQVGSEQERLKEHTEATDAIMANVLSVAEKQKQISTQILTMSAQ